MAAEGQVAIGPNGERAVFEGGQWVMMAAQAAQPARLPGAPVSGGTFLPPVADPARAATARATTARAATDEAQLPFAAETARAQRDKAVADAAKARAEAAAQNLPPDPALAAAIANVGLTEMLASIDDARRQIGTGRATGITGAIARHLPGTTANDLTGSLESIKGAAIMEKLNQLKKASATGASGMGALSEREGDRLAASIAALNGNMSDEALLRSLSRIEAHAHSLQAVGAGENPDDPRVAAKYGITTAAPDDRRAAPGAAGGSGGASGPGPGGGNPSGNPMAGMHLSQGGTETVIDPALNGVNAHVARMIKGGSSATDVRGYLDSVQPGLGAKAANLEQWVQFSHLHPDRPINVALDRVTQPLTPVGSAMNVAAQSPLGAATIGAADFLTGGTLDNMSSNPALKRAEMAGVAQAHPYWTAAGQIAGGAGGALGGEALLGRLGAGGMAAMVGGDALPMAAYGAGSADEGSRLAGGITGGLAGAAGGVIGRGLGRLVSGVADRGVQALAARGIRLTPGQMLGGIPKRIEDGVAGLPVVGDLIRSQRIRGVEDFNRATFNEALQPIGATTNQIGEAGVNEAQQAVSAAYDHALDGTRVGVDFPFVREAAGHVQAGGAIPVLGDQFNWMMGNRVLKQMGPRMSFDGDGIQSAIQHLQRGAASVRNQPMGDAFGEAARGVQGAIENMVERQAPQGIMPLRSANRAYSNLSSVEDAVLAAKNTDGRFMPSQLGTAVVANTRRYAGKRAAARGDRAFFELQRDAQNVLPATIPDTGTGYRTALMLPGALGLAGGGAGAATSENTAEGGGAGLAGGALLGGALLSPYLARGVLQNALTRNRPVAMEQIGRLLANTRLPGALALPLFASPGGQ